MSTAPTFRDRMEAAARLVDALALYRDSHPVVLAIPRGAVPMARRIADALGGDLDVVLVRKLGAPGNPELAIGAVDEGGNVMLDRVAADWAGADEAYLTHEAERQSALIQERRRRYCGGRQGTALLGRTVIVVDDGLATGATMIAALKAVRARAPAWLVCAVPVAAAESLPRAWRYADDVVCLATPSPFGSVGQYYNDFETISDEAVTAALARPSGSDGSRDDDPGARATSHGDR